MEPRADVWARHERRVRDVAYRMTGSLTDADDVAQEVWVRWAATDPSTIDDVEAWLTTVTARLCLDELRSARARRTAYVGPWLPEPVIELPGVDPDPADRVTLDDTVRLALLVVLERLSPAERTSFVLHEVFGLPFTEVADVVGRSVEACRQLASRARRHVRDAPRFAVERVTGQQVVERFREACEAGDLEGLVAVLDPDATGDFDSGGRFPGAPTTTVRGARTIATLLLESLARVPVSVRPATVNGDPGLAVLRRDRIVAVIAPQVRDGRVHHVDAVGNPAKLGRT